MYACGIILRPAQNKRIISFGGEKGDEETNVDTIRSNSSPDLHNIAFRLTL